MDSPRKGLEILESNSFDCIISDYQMTGIDGLEFLKKIRKDMEIDVPFIMFTGRGREEVAMESLNLGADRYIRKGGDPKSQYNILVDAIKNAYEKYRAEEVRDFF